MKKFTIILVILVAMLVGCSSSSSNKILNIVELGKSTRDDLTELNLKMDVQEIYNQDENVYEYNYIWDYASYKLNDVNGTIRIRFTDYDNVAQFVNFSAEATKENMEQILSYLVDNYGEDYEEMEDYTTRWTSDNLIIDYVLTDEDTVEIRWYSSND